jgi:hypothetical protein
MNDEPHSLSRSVLGDIRRIGMLSMFSPHLAGGTRIPFRSYRYARGRATGVGATEVAKRSEGTHSPVTGILVNDLKSW